MTAPLAPSFWSVANAWRRAAAAPVPKLATRTCASAPATDLPLTGLTTTMSAGVDVVAARTSAISCGSVGLLRMTVSTTFDPGAPRSSRVPVNADMSRVGFPSIIRMKSPVWRPAFAAGDPSRTPTIRR